MGVSSTFIAQQHLSLSSFTDWLLDLLQGTCTVKQRSTVAARPVFIIIYI